MAHILIVEDEPSIAALLAMLLTAQNHTCETALDGEIAANQLAEQNYDLVLLDIMLPHINGYELFEYADQIGIPVIFLSAMGEVAQRVKGLRMGAYDYIAKPFAPEELIARVENVLIRNGHGKTTLSAWNTSLDPENRSVYQNGAEISLTPREFDLLELLLINKGAILYRSYLYETIWGEQTEDSSRTLDTHIQRLRQKLGWSDKIKTIYRTGYRLEGES